MQPAEAASPSTIVTTTTEPPPTTTTIDFTVASQGLTAPVPDEPTIDELTDVINDVRGNTADITGEMNRLAPFVQLSSATVAQIVDIAIAAEPGVDGRVRTTSSVVAYVPADGATVATLIDDELRAAGWNRAEQTDNSEGSNVSVERAYRVPGTPGDEQQLVVAVEGEPTEATLLRLEYDVEDDTEENEATLARLTAWQSNLPSPRSSTFESATAKTDGDEATLSLAYSVPAESTLEARRQFAGQLSSAGYDVADREIEIETDRLAFLDPDGHELVATFDRASDPDLMELVVSAEIGMKPIG